MIQVFKIDDIPIEDLFQISESTTRVHKFKIFKESSNKVLNTSKLILGSNSWRLEWWYLLKQFFSSKLGWIDCGYTGDLKT